MINASRFPEVIANWQYHKAWEREKKREREGEGRVHELISPSVEIKRRQERAEEADSVPKERKRERGGSRPVSIDREKLRVFFSVCWWSARSESFCLDRGCVSLYSASKRYHNIRSQMKSSEQNG